MQLSKFASSQPHAIYSAMIHGLSFCWIFLSKTVKDLSSFLVPLEKAIRLHLLPQLCIHHKLNVGLADPFRRSWNI